MILAEAIAAKSPPDEILGLQVRQQAFTLAITDSFTLIARASVLYLRFKRVVGDVQCDEYVHAVRRAGARKGARVLDLRRGRGVAGEVVEPILGSSASTVARLLPCQSVAGKPWLVRSMTPAASGLGGASWSTVMPEEGGAGGV